MNRIADAELLRWLHEDAPHGDLTTRALGIGAAPAQMHFHARGAMRVALIEEGARLVELAAQAAGASAAVQVHRASGGDAAAGDALLSAHGPAEALLLAWKVAQTAVETASGIASAAAGILARVHGAGFADLALACTRKTWPGGRALAVRAVAAGGAVMHRLGLSETLLVFPEHRVFLPADELNACMARLGRHLPEKKRVVEVSDGDEALALARAGIEVLQLERFSPAALAALKTRLADALDYARAGADLLVSSAPYFAPPCDVKVTIAPA